MVEDAPVPLIVRLVPIVPDVVIVELGELVVFVAEVLQEEISTIHLQIKKVKIQKNHIQTQIILHLLIAHQGIQKQKQLMLEKVLVFILILSKR